MPTATEEENLEEVRVMDDAWVLEHFLGQQRTPTAIEKFSKVHDQDALPAQEKYYRDLIPLTAPGKGEQYAFEVDLDACTGCKACVAACHNLNGLDEDEAWRDVGLLLGGTAEKPFQQTVTSACHHCESPACMEGCPVLAYEKDPLTGIVKHLDDQCIGCQYCILKCPYDVPKYNARLGIVRKCDMCSSRLGAGEAPACVQACPNQAIKITVVKQATVLARAEAGEFLPGTPDPGYTRPSTVYKTKKEMPANLLPADHDRVEPGHAHWPLVLMLVLTQMSVGGFLVAACLEWVMGGQALEAVRPVNAVVALCTGLLALGASTLHLGRPLYAYRAILGLRTSWMSREILAFGAFAGLATLYAGLSWMGPRYAPWLPWVGGAVVFWGLAGVFCSAMIYHDTRRVFWDISLTGFKFGMSLAVLGLPLALLSSLVAAKLHGGLDASAVILGWGKALALMLMIAASAKLAFELLAFTHLRDLRLTPMKRSASLMAGELFPATRFRYALGFLGGLLLPSTLLIPDIAAPFAAVFCLLSLFSCLAGEVLERYLFFTAVVSPKMPGGTM